MSDIVCYYCKEFRCYVVYCTDAEGNQLWDCEYYGSKQVLAESFKVNKEKQ